MADQVDTDAEFCDHINGEIIGPMPFGDPEALVNLMQERMTPENFRIFGEEVICLAARKDPERTREMLRQQP